MAKEAANNKKKALGLGIKALLNNIDEDLKDNNAELAAGVTDRKLAHVGGRIALESIELNPMQPRTDFDAQALQELSDSIKLHDVIQPITVAQLGGGKYRLISGERRYRASKMAGLLDIPAYVRLANDQEMLEMALLENLQREDLNAIEIGLSYQRLMDECSLTQEGVAERMNKDRSSIANHLRLLRLPPDLQLAVRQGSLSMGHARAIAGLHNVEDQLYVFREAQSKRLSVRQVEELVRNMLHEPKQDAVTHTKQKQSLPHAYRRLQEDLATALSTKVVLDRKKNGKGTILIDFYSDEDLERIMSVFEP